MENWRYGTTLMTASVHTTKLPPMFGNQSWIFLFGLFLFMWQIQRRSIVRTEELYYEREMGIGSRSEFRCTKERLEWDFKSTPFNFSTLTSTSTLLKKFEKKADWRRLKRTVKSQRKSFSENLSSTFQEFILIIRKHHIHCSVD